jgi:hypothetical protein
MPQHCGVGSVVDSCLGRVGLSELPGRCDGWESLTVRGAPSARGAGRGFGGRRELEQGFAFRSTKPLPPRCMTIVVDEREGR